jgi:hypothetical protein
MVVRKINPSRPRRFLPPADRNKGWPPPLTIGKVEDMDRRGLFFAILTIAAASMASTAMASGVCDGPAPAPGAVLHGPVLDIPDGASLCIAQVGSPTAWTRVSVRQLAANRPQLMAAAFGQNATCRIGAEGLADCTVDGAPLADIVRRPETIKAALQWRRPLASTRIASAAP